MAQFARAQMRRVTAVLPYTYHIQLCLAEVVPVTKVGGAHCVIGGKGAFNNYISGFSLSPPDKNEPSLHCALPVKTLSLK